MQGTFSFGGSTPGGGSTGTLELLRFANRVFVYLALMDDSYPSTDEHRWLPLVKWLLAFPTMSHCSSSAWRRSWR
jgi:hypothetical protein